MKTQILSIVPDVLERPEREVYLKLLGEGKIERSAAEALVAYKPNKYFISDDRLLFDVSIFSSGNVKIEHHFNELELKEIRNVIVLIPDGVKDTKGNFDTLDKVIVTDNLYPVYRNFDRTFCLGSCRMRIEDKMVLADIKIEKFIYDLIVKGAKLYPAVGGTRKFSDNPSQEPFTITELSIGTARNVDDRIDVIKIN